MQPWLEAVAIPEGRTCLIFDRRLPEFGFNWHYHPEYELTLTIGSRGTRFVGGNVAPYEDGDLVLVGPDLPHAWQSHSLAEGADIHRAIVCWFTEDWISGLVRLMPELAPLSTLVRDAANGVAFDPSVSASLRERLEELCQRPPQEQIVDLQAILIELAIVPARRTLSVSAPSPGSPSRDRWRMERILTWLHGHYGEPLRLAPLCRIAHLSESQLQRIFKRSTGRSISDYVTRLRVGRACTMLAETERPMSVIATDSGFSDAAHFARKFRGVTGRTPTAYRSEFRAAGPVALDGIFPMRRKGPAR